MKQPLLKEDVAQVKKVFVGLMDSVASRIRPLPEDLRKFVNGLYVTWLDEKDEKTKILRATSNVIRNMVDGIFENLNSWDDYMFQSNYGDAAEIELLGEASAALDKIFERADAIARGEASSPAEADMALRFIKLVRECPAGAVNEVDSGMNSRLLDAFSLVHREDPKVEQESSAALIQKAVAVNIAIRGEEDTLTRIEEAEERLRRWLSAIATMEDEDFKAFVKKLEGIFGPLRDFEIDYQEIGDITNTMADAGAFVEGLRYLIERYLAQGNLRVQMQRAMIPDPAYIMHKAYSRKDDPKGERFLVALSDAVGKTVKSLEAGGDAPPDVAPGTKDPIFGNYVFAPARRREVPFEKNTPDEAHAYDQLKKHVVDNVAMDDEAALALMQALEAGAYPGIIHEPKAEYVFRGLSLDKIQLARLIGEEPTEHSGFKKTSKWAGAKGERQGSTGWSTDKGVAASFSFSSLNKPYSVMLVARVKDNPDTFLEGPNGFYKVKSLGVYPSEKETIALGPAKLYKVYWQQRSSFDKDVIEESPRHDLVREWVRALLKA